MNNALPDWKAEYIHELEESLAFFSNASKLEREIWVVRRLISALGIDFKEEEFRAGQEPTDVIFRDGYFQIKEKLNEGRKRTDELKKKLERARTAQSYGDLLEHYTPQNITFAEITEQCSEAAKVIANHYGAVERKKIDLIYYFNYIDFHETLDGRILGGNKDFRSFSVVSNGFCCVINTSEEAPAFLSKNNGRIVKLY